MSNLGGITQYQNQFQTGQNLAGTGGGAAGVQNTAVTVAPEASGTVRQELMQLGKGSMFTGTVTQMRDGNVTISLDNGQLLHARLDSGVSVTQGQPVLFEVKSNLNNQLMLRQVPVESAFNPTLQKALAAAGLAASGRNLAMVNAMMQNQLPINKSSLLTMARQLAANPGVSVESLAQMKKLGFPITETMVQQFEAYKQGNHALVERFSQMMEQLPQLLSEADGSPRQLMELQNGLLQALEILEEGAVQEEAADAVSSEPGGASLGEAAGSEGSGVPGAPGGTVPAGTAAEEILNQQNAESVLGKEGQSVASQAGAEGQEGVTQASGSGNELSRMMGAESGNGLPPGAGSGNGVPQALGNGNEVSPAADGQMSRAGAGNGNEATQAAESQNALPKSGAAPVLEFLDHGQLEGLEHQLRQLGMDADPVLFPGGKLNTAMNAGEMLREIAQQLELQNQTMTGEKIKSLFSGKGYQGLLKQAVSEQWLLEPGQVEQERAVEKLYERLERQMGKLSQLMQQEGKQDLALARNTAQVRGNLEMMNQINQLYNYVQIPLKLRGQNAHSDLYVYTNKKSLRDRDGELSALLHLELDHLGVTDVRIKMLGSHVTTHFCMSDEAALELVEEHLDELTEALSRKGYQCSFQTERRQEEMDFVEDFLEHEAPVGKLARYSFDVLT